MIGRIMLIRKTEMPKLLIQTVDSNRDQALQPSQRLSDGRTTWLGRIRLRYCPLDGGENLQASALCSSTPIPH